MRFIQLLHTEATYNGQSQNQFIGPQEQLTTHFYCEKVFSGKREKTLRSQKHPLPKRLTTLSVPLCTFFKTSSIKRHETRVPFRPGKEARMPASPGRSPCPSGALECSERCLPKWTQIQWKPRARIMQNQPCCKFIQSSKFPSEKLWNFSVTG